MALGMVDLQDKVRGMLLLGAYGDALGAPTEGKPPPTSPVSRLPFSREIHDGPGGPWGCWLPAERIPEVTIGMVTDDTLFRHFIWIPFLDGCLKKALPVSEGAFIQFLEEALREPSNSPLAIRFGEEFACNRAAQIRDWLAMFAAARAGESDSQAETCFFKPGQPICFGLFMLPTLAAWMIGKDDAEVFETFLLFLSLDQGHAKEATGILGVFIKRALSTDPQEVNCPAEWFQESWSSMVPILRSRGETGAVERIEQTVTQLLALASQVRGLSPGETRHHLHEERRDRLPAGVTGLGFDPAEFLAVIAFALAASHMDLHRAFGLIVNSGGDTDTLASVFGQVIGALMGERRLLQACSAEMLADLEHVDRTANEVFGIEWGIEGLSAREIEGLKPHSTALRL